MSQGLVITNPLTKYRTLVATGRIRRDNSQLRLALHLQKLYDRLIDYEPRKEYSRELDRLAKTVASQDESEEQQTPSSRRNSTWRTLMAAKERRDSLALTRRLSSHEEALQLTSPRGLMLHGEVGTGKSMLVDLFADCLPNRKKRRWHFNTFMLETFAKLEALRRTRSQIRPASQPPQLDDEDHSMLHLAKDLIETSPILFLDEFQLPDRAASKILTNLMTSFFQLGGVLIATSNRMPDELDRAAGMHYAPPPSTMRSLGWKFGMGKGKGVGSGTPFAGPGEFAQFLDVLKARCEVWEMEGGRDWRRLESGSVKARGLRDQDEALEEWQLDGHDDLQSAPGMAELAEDKIAEESQSSTVALPINYLLDADTEAVKKATEQPWQPSTMTVYGRTIPVPRTNAGTAYWTFNELCTTTLGPADFTTIASKYHTIILTDVPILTWNMKNEARRFITLLDALYECKCKLLIQAATGPDDLFFPDAKQHETSAQHSEDAVYAETLAEVYQDQTAPFRPNVLSANPDYAEPATSPEPDYTHARLAGLQTANAWQLEDDPPNRPHGSPAPDPFSRSFGRTDSEMQRAPIDPDDDLRARNGSSGRRGPDFGRTSAFTGEDERFAYKRAESRLWEMTGAKWWAREGEDWHRPLPAEVRKWERPIASTTTTITNDTSRASSQATSDAAMGPATPDSSRSEESFRQPSPPRQPLRQSPTGLKASENDPVNALDSSPFRTASEPPPKFSWTHIWGTMKWGPRAGAWGKGVEGLEEKEKEKERARREEEEEGRNKGQR
ncbi:hypothetical protein MBLNU230_g1521t1 [Neophaeotheca triangularis]